MKTLKIKKLAFLLLLLLTFSYRSFAQYEITISNSLVPSCTWSLEVYDASATLLNTFTSTTTSTCISTGTPLKFVLNGPGCSTYTWLFDPITLTWPTGPFTFSCLPSSFCTPNGGSFTFSSTSGCSSTNKAFTFSF